MISRIVLQVRDILNRVFDLTKVTIVAKTSRGNISDRAERGRAEWKE